MRKEDFLKINCFASKKKPQWVKLFKVEFETKHVQGPAI